MTATDPSPHYNILRQYIVSGPSRGEYRAYCPLCEDKATSSSPSASFNFEKRVWHCQSCKEGGSLRALVRALKARPEPVDDPFMGKVRPLRNEEDGKLELNNTIAMELHRELLERPNEMRWLIEERGLTEAVIEEYRLGWQVTHSRYTIPVYDTDGEITNIRRYKRDADQMVKMINWPGWGTPPRLYPDDQLDHDTILLVEGELDALRCISAGVPAVSGTHGGGNWMQYWSKQLAGKHVVVSYDNDRTGKDGARKAARSLSSFAVRVAVLPPLLPEPKSDVTDWFRKGGDAAGLRALMEEALAQVEAKQVKEETPELASVGVIGSMDARTNGRPLTMSVMVSGRSSQTYNLPHRVHASCTLDAGNKCKQCPMNLEHEGDYEFEMPVSGPRLGEVMGPFIDANKTVTQDLLRQFIGAPKCGMLEVDHENITVEELFYSPPMDGEDDYTRRRAYHFRMNGQATQANMAAKVVGTTWPSPKDNRNEFYGWELSEALTSLDSFQMTPELRKEMARVFQCARRQRPIDKCRDIAQDLISTVTHIVGRERMHMAMDLVFHSVLRIPFDGQVIKGWLELGIYGDTRTGKSKTAQLLVAYYGLGHVVNCEGATLAGLIGGVKEIAKQWSIEWGELPLNDRRLVVLDEASGLRLEIIGQMSEVRSAGVAQLIKVERQVTNSRVRLIWIGNAREDAGIVNGIDVMESVMGKPEDIARLDMAMSVHESDVPTEQINQPHFSMDEPFYTQELCRSLVLWAWSRKPEHVVWSEGAEEAVYERSKWLGERYISVPPLVQAANVREKIARVAVALAVRTFNTDKTGELVLVDRRHVEDAATFLDQLYSYENFGYRLRSEQVIKHRAIALAKTEEVTKWLRSNPSFVRFLSGSGAQGFRRRDIEEMSAETDAFHAIDRLTKAHMIYRKGAQYLMEPELTAILRRLENQ